MGRAYLQLKRTLPTAPTYMIVETAAVCARGRELVPDITFVDRLPDVANPDIVYVRTSLQYLEDPLGTLRRLFTYGPRFVLLADTSAGEIPTFATAQLNIRGSVIPCWFLSIDAIVDAAAGYELLMRVKGNRKLPRMAVPSGYRLDRTVDLLFGPVLTR
jgi:putative methyltransferase (TIGR04325 family)